MENCKIDIYLRIHDVSLTYSLFKECTEIAKTPFVIL